MIKVICLPSAFTEKVPNLIKLSLLKEVCMCVFVRVFNSSCHMEKISMTVHQILFFFYFINFIFKLYIIVLVLPNIKMNPPQVLYKI